MHFLSLDFPRGKTVLEKLSRYGNILDIFDFISGIEAIVIRDWDTFSKLFVAVLCASMLWFTGWILIIASGKGNLAFILINLSCYKCCILRQADYINYALNSLHVFGSLKQCEIDAITCIFY